MVYHASHGSTDARRGGGLIGMTALAFEDRGVGRTAQLDFKNRGPQPWAASTAVSAGLSRHKDFTLAEPLEAS